MPRDGALPWRVMAEMSGRHVIFISNGHGEDLIASRVASELRTLSEAGGLSVEISGVPLVGMGRSYEECGIETVGPRAVLPSGGFARSGLKHLAADLAAGLLGITVRQVRAIRRHSAEARCRSSRVLGVCVGDVWCLWIGTSGLGAKAIFMPTAKSDYIRPHFGVERALIRRRARAVIARDELTASGFRAHGIDAVWLGNVMMDAVGGSRGDLAGELGLARPLVGILPGSRAEAVGNMVHIVRVMERLGLDGVVALADSISPEELGRRVTEATGGRWAFREPDAADLARGVAGRLIFDGVSADVGDGHEVRPVVLTKGRFGDVLAAADIVVGLAGTANEQAAGLGKPVVTFPGDGPQFTPKFARAQKRLLGDAVRLVEPYDPSAVAAAVQEILSCSETARRMGEAGMARMGGPGASRKIAEFLLCSLEEER